MLQRFNFFRIINLSYYFHPFEIFITNVISGMGNTGGCVGDSGGPLVVNGILVGIVSFGDYPCNSGSPTVSTRLTEYTDWLKTNSDIEL